MASATRLPLRSITALMTIALGVGAVNSRSAIMGFFTGPGSTSRIVAFLVIIANAKNFPFVWHIRVWHAILKHFLFSPRTITPALAGFSERYPALYRPTITRSRSPLAECDYNLHKSNSTYFSDLDVTRSHLISALLRQGIKSLQDNPRVIIAPNGSPVSGKWFIMLGAVACSFKREIKPYQPYEMWTRLLAWDRKWVYVVTHFVEANAVIPKDCTFENGQSVFSRLFGQRKSQTGQRSTWAQPKPDESALLEMDPKAPHKAVFATAVSKYVMKLGRLTIHPEVVIGASGLLPPKPGGWVTMTGPQPTAVSAPNATTAHADATPHSPNGEWNWKRIEEENARGLEYAKHFAALDELHGEFRDDQEQSVLGVYPDVLTF